MNTIFVNILGIALIVAMFASLYIMLQNINRELRDSAHRHNQQPGSIYY